MTDEQFQRDQAALRATIDGVSHEALKAHMLAALNSFGSQDSAQSSPATPSTSQTESDKSDAIVKKLMEKEVKVQKPRDALFVAIHALLLEAGFKLSTRASSEFVLPENWDANSASGLFTAEYVHPNDDSINFSLKGLFVGGKFEVYISDDKDNTQSMELSVDEFIAPDELMAPVAAASLLHNLKELRSQFALFAEGNRPTKKNPSTSAVSSPLVHPPPREANDRNYGAPPPFGIPAVGGGDAFPPNLGGGNPDMLVGPGHPLFGHRGDPSVGPVPGARFDPFGPSIDPLGPSGFGRGPGRGPAPRMPFGGPGPDHLRMPRDDDDNFGFGGNRGGGGGFSQPFGSNNAFF